MCVCVCLLFIEYMKKVKKKGDLSQHKQIYVNAFDFSNVYLSASDNNIE